MLASAASEYGPSRFQSRAPSPTFDEIRARAFHSIAQKSVSSQTKSSASGGTSTAGRYDSMHAVGESNSVGAGGLTAGSAGSAPTLSRRLSEFTVVASDETIVNACSLLRRSSALRCMIAAFD